MKGIEIEVNPGLFPWSDIINRKPLIAVFVNKPTEFVESNQKLGLPFPRENSCAFQVSLLDLMISQVKGKRSSVLGLNGITRRRNDLWFPLFQAIEMYKNEEMEYELSPKSEFFVWFLETRLRRSFLSQSWISSLVGMDVIEFSLHPQTIHHHPIMQGTKNWERINFPFFSYPPINLMSYTKSSRKWNSQKLDRIIQCKVKVSLYLPVISY